MKPYWLIALIMLLPLGCAGTTCHCRRGACDSCSPCVSACSGCERPRFLPRGFWVKQKIQALLGGPAVVLSVPPACTSGCGGPTPWIPPKFPQFDEGPVRYSSPPPAMYAETRSRWPEPLRETPRESEPGIPPALPELNRLLGPERDQGRP